MTGMAAEIATKATVCHLPNAKLTDHEERAEGNRIATAAGPRSS
jgi:hypothetical protein